MIPEIHSGRKRTLALAVTFALSVCLGLFLFLAPALIIRPFRFQSARALNFAMAVRQQAPIWSLIIAAGTVIPVVFLWRRGFLLERGLPGGGGWLVGGFWGVF